MAIILIIAISSCKKDNKAGTDVTVVVTSHDQEQLTGTFSGKLVNVNYEGGLGGPRQTLQRTILNTFR